MERPWVILCRVLHVDQPGDVHVQANAVDNAEVIDPEEDEHQVQDEQHAGVGEAEEDVVAVDEAAEAQALHAAVGEGGWEGGHALDEQHAAGAEEAEEDDVAAVNAAAEAAAQAQHAEVVEAVEDAHAQDAQHAGVGEAEEQVAAVNVAAEAQDGQAAVGDEAEQALQAQLEEGVLNMNPNAAVAEAAHALQGAGEPDVAVTVAPPPRLSTLTAGPGSHPNPEHPDMYPYIVATGRFCLLAHFAIAPNHGTNFDPEPIDSYLVVVRYFRRADDGRIAAIAVQVPDRPDDDDDLPPLRNIESVGLACIQQTGHYAIAELMVTTGADPEAAVISIRTDIGVWQSNYFANPLLVENRGPRQWVPHGTVTINTTVLWYDLSWGIVSCDLEQPDLEDQMLNFHRLPPGRVLLVGVGVPDLHSSRCIAVSENLLRYVEIIFHPHEAARVKMWYRDLEAIPLMWRTNYSESFADIWANESYANTGLPQNPPMLVGVSPVNSNVVYFSLNHRLFGVNVPEHTVVHCEEYQPLNRPGPHDEPDTSRFLITWNLDADQAPNAGHQPDDPSDHGDLSDGGPVDVGEIDYESPRDGGPVDEGEIDYEPLPE